MNFFLAIGNAWLEPGNPVVSVLAGIILFLVVHFIGQILKKRTGVRLGFAYEFLPPRWLRLRGC